MKVNWKSVWAIFAGFLIVVVLSTLTDFVFESANIIPKGKLPLYGAEGLIIFILVYRTVYTIFGMYVTARLAPNHPMRHVMIGASIGVVFGMLGVIANATMKLGPDWYPWALVILAIPSAWVGGKLAVGKKKTTKK